MSLNKLMNDAEITVRDMCTVEAQHGESFDNDATAHSSEGQRQKAKTELKTWFNKFPKGSLDWQDKGPQNEEDFSALFEQLTNLRWRDLPRDSVPPHGSLDIPGDQDVTAEERRYLPYIDVLNAFLSRHASELQDKTSEMHVAVLAAAAHVAVKKGVPAHKVDELTSIKLKDLRAGICKYLCILDTMQEWYNRALELPIHRPPFILSARSFGGDHFDLLKTVEKVGKADNGGEEGTVAGDIRVYLPESRPYETKLCIPGIVHELYAGRLSLDDVKMTLRPVDGPARHSKPGAEQRQLDRRPSREHEGEHDKGVDAKHLQKPRPRPVQPPQDNRMHKPFDFEMLLNPYSD